MSFMCSSNSILTSDFKSNSCFYGVLGYPVLAVVGELASDAAIMPWFLLVTFLRFPLAIWFSQELDGLIVTGSSFNLLWTFLRLFLQHWMTGFLLAQITDMLASSFVPLEPFSVLPQAMLYLGCQG